MAVVNTQVTIPAAVTSTGDVVVSGGSLIVSAGGGICLHGRRRWWFHYCLPVGTATGTMVADEHGLFDGQGIVGGLAISTVVGSGGLEVVALGWRDLRNAVVLGGGIEDIGFSGFEGGSAVGISVNGGAAFINSGWCVVHPGPVLVNGGVLTVFSGGTDSHASVG